MLCLTIYAPGFVNDPNFSHFRRFYIRARCRALNHVSVFLFNRVWCCYVGLLVWDAYVSCELYKLIYTGSCRRVTSRYYFPFFVRLSGAIFLWLFRYRIGRTSDSFCSPFTNEGSNIYLLTTWRRTNSFKYVDRVISANFRGFSSDSNGATIRFIF